MPVRRSGSEHMHKVCAVGRAGATRNEVRSFQEHIENEKAFQSAEGK